MCPASIDTVPKMTKSHKFYILSLFMADPNNNKETILVLTPQKVKATQPTNYNKNIFHQQ